MFAALNLFPFPIFHFHTHFCGSGLWEWEREPYYLVRWSVYPLAIGKRSLVSCDENETAKLHKYGSYSSKSRSVRSLTMTQNFSAPNHGYEHGTNVTAITNRFEVILQFTAAISCNIVGVVLRILLLVVLFRLHKFANLRASWWRAFKYPNWLLLAAPIHFIVIRYWPAS